MKYAVAEHLVTTEGVIVDDNHFLCSFWVNGSLYKISLDGKIVEFVRDLSSFRHLAQRYSCMLKVKTDVYMIGFSDVYEILRYNTSNNHIEVCYQRECPGLRIFQTFLIGESLYILPENGCHDICIYHLESGTAQYIKWEKILPNFPETERDCLIYYDCDEHFIWGTIYGTSHIIKLDLDKNLKGEILNLNGKRLTQMSVFQNVKYVFDAECEEILCLDLDGYIKRKIKIKKRKDLYQNYLIDDAIVQIDQNRLILLPCIKYGSILIVEIDTGKCIELEYPSKFQKMRQVGRLFWDLKKYRNQVYLPAFEGNGFLTLNLEDYTFEYQKILIDDKDYNSIFPEKLIYREASSLRKRSLEDFIYLISNQ